MEQHRKLMQWACDCSERALHLSGKPKDIRLQHALDIARRWRQDDASVEDARRASLGAIQAARQSTNAAATAVARSVGHAVATAHMADHSLLAASYALKAVKYAGGSVEDERTRQDKLLPAGIKTLVLSARKRKGI
jgi:hypothetical protein